MHYVLLYEVVPDFLERRNSVRGEHLKKAWVASERGELLLAGAVTGGELGDSAMLLFQGDSPKVAEDFARADPYVTTGLVTRWRVRQWHTVVGDKAAAPVRP
jgi:uncharacterized protein